MKITFPVILATIGLAAAIAISHRLLRAQTTGCNASMVTGTYSYALNGSVFNAGTLAGFYSSLGIITADGKGSLTGPTPPRRTERSSDPCHGRARTPCNPTAPAR
jgi:hypothetical protein